VRGDNDFVLLNQHLTATPPSPRKVNPHLSVAQERALYKALAKSPQERFQTAGEFIQAMAPRDTPLPSMVKTPSKIRGSRPMEARRIRRALLVGGILLLLVVLLVGMIWLLWPAYRPGGVGTEGIPPSVPGVSTAVPLIESTLPGSVMPERRASLVPATATPSRTPRPTATLALAISPTPRSSP
jgi:hypothetical protein